jgi:hypothetical protein
MLAPHDRIKASAMTQVQASQMFGMSQPRIADLYQISTRVTHCPKPFVLSLSKHCPCLSVLYKKEGQPFDIDPLGDGANGGGLGSLQLGIRAARLIYFGVIHWLPCPQPQVSMSKSTSLRLHEGVFLRSFLLLVNEIAPSESSHPFRLWRPWKIICQPDGLACVVSIRL